MKRFQTTALIASTLAVGLAGAAVAQDTQTGDIASEKMVPAATVMPALTPIAGKADLGKKLTSMGPHGPATGWQVLGSDGAPLGTVVHTMYDTDGNLSHFIFALPNGNEVQMPAESVAAVGEGAMSVAVPAAKVAMAATAPMTALTVTR